MSILIKKIKPTMGHSFPIFYSFQYLIHSIAKHTNTTKENLTPPKKAHFLHGNYYLSKFLGHLPSIMLKLPTNHPHAVWCTFPSKGHNTHNKKRAPSLNSYLLCRSHEKQNTKTHNMQANETNKWKKKQKKLWTFGIHNLSWCPTIL